MTEAEAADLYRAMGKRFATFEPWQIYVLTSCEQFERLYGRRADKTRKLYNGMLPCYLYQFFRPAGTAPTKPPIKQGKDFKKYKK
jgi:putative N6-adenine-specific DNA methylase